MFVKGGCFRHRVRKIFNNNGVSVDKDRLVTNDKLSVLPLFVVTLRDKHVSIVYIEVVLPDSEVCHFLRLVDIEFHQVETNYSILSIG